jgi:hypothetical protein
MCRTDGPVPHFTAASGPKRRRRAIAARLAGSRLAGPAAAILVALNAAAVLAGHLLQTLVS